MNTNTSYGSSYVTDTHMNGSQEQIDRIYDVPMTLRVACASPARATEIAEGVAEDGNARASYYGFRSVAVAGEPAEHVPATTVVVTFEGLRAEDEERIRTLINTYAHYLPGGTLPTVVASAAD